MSIAETPRQMTVEELLAMPDDGVERWLIRGELRWRRWMHRTPAMSSCITGLCCALNQWAREVAPVRGVVLIDAYHRFACDPDTILGIDISLISKRQSESSRRKPFVEGCPLLAVKILSSADSHADMTEAVHEYLNAGATIVWIVDPDFETVAVFRSDAEPVSFNRQQELTAEPHLPGFRVRVAELFE